MENERERLLYQAKLAEQAERYDDMVEAMKGIAKLGEELTAEERNLISVAYKNAIGAKRTSWRILLCTEDKEEEEGNDLNVKMVKDYKMKIEEEISNICSDMLSVVDKHLLPFSSTGESTIFYYKMKGDYYRYSAEFKTGIPRLEAANEAQSAYEAAISKAASQLPPTHPIRLGLALNFSVFFHEIVHNPERACYVAQKAFDEATEELANLKEKSKDESKESTLIMQLLEDNLTLWAPQLED